jgi:HEAT repeat protein
LNRLADPDSLPALCRAAKHSRAATRAGVVNLLRKFAGHSDSVVPVLLEALRDEDASVRLMAADALARFGNDDRVVPALCQAMQDKTPPSQPGSFCVATMAMYSLGLLGGKAEKAIPDLIDITRSGTLALRRSSIRALGDIAAKEKKVRPKLLPLFSELLRQGDAQVICEGAFALGKMGADAKEAVPALSAALLPQRNREDAKEAKLIRRNILWALEQMGPAAADAVPEVVAVLEDKSLSNDEHQSAATVLGSIGPKAEAAVPALTRATTDPEYFVQKAAEDALKKIQR